MSIIAHGVVQGQAIKLSAPLGLSDGQEVELVVRAVDARGSWGEGIMRSAGVAADVPGFDEAFAEIERERKASWFREPMQ